LARGLMTIPLYKGDIVGNMNYESTIPFA